MSEGTLVINALCSPPWNFNVHRAWGIIDEHQLTSEKLAAWQKFAAERGQRLASFLITKQAEPPAPEKSHIDLVHEAAERARAKA